MTATPSLLTYVRNQTEQRERSIQTAFPAKVLSYDESSGTVKLEPQFLEVWRDANGRQVEPIAEKSDAYIDNVPVCFPHFMSWTIDSGTFGLVICTKYSLDVWREQLGPVDPGDLRRFTMSGATFHPVVIGQSPSVAQQFVALKDKVETELTKIKNDLAGIECSNGTISHIAPYTTVGNTASSKVKAET